MSQEVSLKKFSFTRDPRRTPLSKLSYPYILPNSAPDLNNNVQPLPAGLGPAFSCLTLCGREGALPDGSFEELFFTEVGC